MNLPAPEYTAPPKRQKILVVVDPTAHEQAALAKAVLLAELCRGSLELYVCDVEQKIPESWTGASRAGEYRELMRQRLVGELRRLAEPLKARGLNVSTYCEWQAQQEQQEQGIGYHVIRTLPDLVVMESDRQGTDWNLVRQVPVPLLFVGPDPWRVSPQEIADSGRSLADLLDGILEVVHVRVEEGAQVLEQVDRDVLVTKKRDSCTEKRNEPAATNRHPAGRHDHAAGILAVSPARQEFLDATSARPNKDSGAELYRGCAICHGPDGGGNVDGNIPRISASIRA